VNNRGFSTDVNTPAASTGMGVITISGDDTVVSATTGVALYMKDNHRNYR